MRIFWKIIPIVLFALLVLFFWRGLSLDPQLLPSVQLGKPLPAFKLPILNSPNTKLTPAVMRGHISILNVWASWCESCANEQVFLLELARQGIVIYGINYKDSAKKAARWLDEWGNPYTLIGEDHQGTAAIDLGVYGTPETFLIDKSGVIQYRYAGVLTEVIWKREFLPRIKGLE